MDIHEKLEQHEKMFLKMQETHESAVSQILNYLETQNSKNDFLEGVATRALELMNGLKQEFDYLRSCFEVLRDKTQALAIMVGDIQDRPSGSLRERISALEDHAVNHTWKDEILDKLPEKEIENKSLHAAFEQESERLKAFLKTDD